MRKLICIFLLAVIFISCGTSSNDTNPETTSDNLENNESIKDPEMPVIADADYGSRDFVIYYNDWSLYKDYYFSDSQNGEIINDACYDRTVLIEEKLKINIKSIASTEPDGGSAEDIRFLSSSAKAFKMRDLRL